jgi:glycosyltransferase involved in cell wall biosynthesis
VSELRALELGMGWFPDELGGVSRYYRELLEHLPAAQVEVRGLVTGAESVAARTERTVSSFAPTGARLLRRWRGARRSVRSLLRREPFSLVAAHFALYTFPVLDLVRSLPLVVHFHGPWALEAKAAGAAATPWKALLERVVYGRAHRLIVLSHFFRELLARQHGVPERRIQVIPGGVDLRRFSLDRSRRDSRIRLGWPEDRRLLLAVRRLTPRMGLDRLIDAMEAVRRRVPDVLLLIAGTGPLAPELSARILARDLVDHVRLIGFVPDERLADAYRAAELSVVPSVALEGFGLAVTESLASGTPVLGTPVGGMPEILRGLDEALVLEGASPPQLAAALIDALLGRRPLPDERRCHAYAQARYAWPTVATQVADAYRSTLSGGAS